MRKKPIPIGSKVGSLLVKQDLLNGFYLCLCDCGKEYPVVAGNLRRSQTVSCGCSRKGKKAWNKGMKMSPAFSLALSRGLKGRPSHRKGKKMGPHSFESRLKRSLSLRGEKAPGWKGGLTAKHLLIRTSFEYREWRRKVYERDNYTCQDCGDNRGNNLNADHIRPFSKCPESRFDVNNGRTLCVPCHKKTPTWGSKALLWR